MTVHYQVFEVTSKEDVFVMIAPMKVLSQYLRLHTEAEKRIVAETKEGGECELHSGSSEAGTHRVHKVILVPANKPIVHRKKRPYFTLLEFREGSWTIQFGDYDREVVEAEGEDFIDHGIRKKNLKIIRTEDGSKATIDAAVIEENRKQQEKGNKVGLFILT